MAVRWRAKANRAAWLALGLVGEGGGVWRAGGRLTLGVAAAADGCVAEPSIRAPAKTGDTQNIIARGFGGRGNSP